jgi:hypothetical protein
MVSVAGRMKSSSRATNWLGEAIRARPPIEVIGREPPALDRAAVPACPATDSDHGSGARAGAVRRVSRNSGNYALDQAVTNLVDSLARAIAREDHGRGRLELTLPTGQMPKDD